MSMTDAKLRRTFGTALNETPAQPLAGRGEPDWRALSVATLAVEGAACDLVDTFDNAERTVLANEVQKAVESLRRVRRAVDARLHVATINTPTNAGKRWTSLDDHYLATYWGPAMREFKGDTEKAVAALAGSLKRTPVSIAARLVGNGIWH